MHKVNAGFVRFFLVDLQGKRNVNLMNSKDNKTLICRDIVDLFGEYVDDELNPALKESVTEHISGCPECREFEKSYRFVIEAAALLRPPEVEMPAGARNRLRDVLNRRLGISLPMAGR